MNEPRPKSARQRWERLKSLPEREARAEALRWDWYALLRLAQAAYPEGPLLGQGLHLEEDPVRLGQPTFFHAPGHIMADFKKRGPREGVSASYQEKAEAGASAGEVGGVVRPEDPAWVYAHHLGLFGPFGPLPTHLTEYAHQRSRPPHRDQARKEISLDRAQVAVGGGEAAGPRGAALSSEWDSFVGALIGCGLESLRHRDSIPEHAKLYFAGRLAQATRSAEGLRAILEDYFDVPAEVVEFQPRTLPIPEAARWSLGAAGDSGYLGWSTVVGSAVRDYQTGFRIRLGPLKFEQLIQFLPDAAGFAELHDWIRLYCGHDTDPNPAAGLESAWDLQLVLLGSEVPPPKLDGTGRLGYTTWLYAQAPEHAVEDIVLRPRVGGAAPKSAKASAAAAPPAVPLRAAAAAGKGPRSR